MTTPPSDMQPQRVFTPRRRRTLLSFRRKRDILWAAISFGTFCIGLTALGYTLLQWRRVGWQLPAAAPRSSGAAPVPSAAEAPLPETAHTSLAPGSLTPMDKPPDRAPQ